MSAIKQIVSCTGIATVLVGMQYAILTRQQRRTDILEPVFHVAFVSWSTLQSSVNTDLSLASCLHSSREGSSQGKGTVLCNR
jgi:hypothetical protein